jgi:hypothetical protein
MSNEDSKEDNYNARVEDSNSVTKYTDSINAGKTTKIIGFTVIVV